MDMFNYLKDCIDCYFVMCRQKDRKALDDESCQDLLQFIARARYNAGDLMEDIRIQEKNAEAKVFYRLLDHEKKVIFLI